MGGGKDLRLQSQTQVFIFFSYVKDWSTDLIFGPLTQVGFCVCRCGTYNQCVPRLAGRWFRLHLSPTFQGCTLLWVPFLKVAATAGGCAWLVMLIPLSGPQIATVLTNLSSNWRFRIFCLELGSLPSLLKNVCVCLLLDCDHEHNKAMLCQSHVGRGGAAD